MCKVSDKLQLCTCSKIDLDKAKHYWVLHRYVKGQEFDVIGTSIMPYGIDEETDLENRKLLITILNEKAVFDIPIHPKEGDLLELSFQLNNQFQRITYGFKFKSGEWHEEEYDAFGWMAQHQEAKSGRIKNAIKKTND